MSTLPTTPPTPPPASDGSLPGSPAGLEPTPLGDRFWNHGFTGLAVFVGWASVGLVVLIVLGIIWQAWPVLHRLGLGFLTGTTWSASREQFGLLPEIWGTVYSALLALLLGTTLGLAVAIFLTEDFLPPRIEMVLKNLVELLAAIPSVVYGLWGIFVVIPAIRPSCNWSARAPGLDPLFGTRLSSPGLLPAALVLAIMVLPTVTALSRDALPAVPQKLREAAVGLGATRWETILDVILPTAATRHLRSGDHRLRPGPGRNDGPGHAGGQSAPADLVAVLAGRHPGGPAGQQVPRGRPRRGGRR